jgi:membrane-bound serine protease (ClpP class)
MKHKILLFLCGFFLLSPGISYTVRAVFADDSIPPDTVAASEPLEPRTGPRPIVYVMSVEDAIGTVTDDRIEDAIALSEEEGAQLLVIQLDTPGGFMKATQSITRNILNSEVPVCMYVSPSGARAGSAGVFMTYAAQIAAMAPSTNIGAAHPVGGEGQEIDSVMNEKVTNDAVAQIKAAARRHGRNAEWAEKAVRESVSITETEALELNVIDLVAQDIPDLLRQLDGRTIELAAGDKTMDLKDPDVRRIAMSFVYKILTILSSPDVAFILFSIGGLGIVLELYHPGAILPGVVGAISLILAFYSFQTLPINYAGVLLILLAVILFIAEIKITSYGMLTVGGVISLFLGGLMLIDTVDPSLKVSMSLLISITVFIGLVVAAVVYLVARAAKTKPFVGHEHLIGGRGDIRSPGMMYVDGALWKVESDEALEVGDRVEITAVEGIRLRVKKVTQK